MKTKRILAAAAIAVLATLAGGYASHMFFNRSAHLATAPAQPNAVEQLWTAAVTNPDGASQSLSRFKGHAVVVNFWASWCAPCVEEMPELVALHHEYAKKGVQFIGLGVDSEQNVKAFLQKVNVDYPVYVTGFGGAELARAFGNQAGGLPFTVVIDANGVVRSTKLGQIQQKELRQTLDAL
ncbi:TlpA disulfide reductase family protein [Paraburkholderia bonniea]|uniref:TlpA family protein disulfide reductase n=1 Tax=Paraburkholderia bonniea TaxID=2152891 RepID=UPI001290A0FE|nr:TlpA disulfide reductase family protein [Paraburkholderia bonniea]WJF89889.1 TlpA disulfide reductase family protein [Paraburkholderia bonniea]WJF93203.1 TlpA disulfide reductase family protein [Paraburkholderia bonniea]